MHVGVHPLLIVFIKDSKDLVPQRVIHDCGIVRVVQLVMDGVIKLLNLPCGLIVVLLAAFMSLVLQVPLVMG